MQLMNKFREWVFGINMPVHERVHNPCMGTFRILIFTTIVTFWLIYPIMTGLMYQKQYRLRGVITSINLEGVIDNTDIKPSDLPLSMQNNSAAYIKMYNPEDLMIPYQGIGPYDGIFVITNFAVTNNKTMSTCPEDPVISTCKDDFDCKNSTSFLPGKPFPYNGIPTGRCIPSDIQEGVKTCEIRGWCPTTRRTQPMKNGKAIVEKVGNLHITVHSLGLFEGTNLNVYNIQQVKDVLNGSALAGCIYSASDDVMRLCPRFSILDTVMQAKGTRQNESFSNIALKGAVVSIRLLYDCNMDTLPLEKCHPTYSIHRQDNILTNDGNGELKGISQSLSAVNYHSEKMKTVAVYDGIRFMVDMEGVARRTELKSLWTSLGLLFSWLIVVLKVMPYVHEICLKCYQFLKESGIAVMEFHQKDQHSSFDNHDDDDVLLP